MCYQIPLLFPAGERCWSARGFCRKAFTLIELLVVIAIIGVLVGLLLPAVQASRESARQTQCINHLKQIGLAVQNFESQRKELPPSRNYDHYTTWAFLILPFMEQTALPDEWDDELKYYYQSDAARQTNIPPYSCPSRRSGGLLSIQNDDILSPYETSGHVPGIVSDYACSAGFGVGWNWIHSKGAMIMGRGITDPETIPEGNYAPPGAKLISYSSRTTYASLFDGASHTILVGEKHVRPTHQGIAQEDGAIYNGDHPGSFARCGGPGYPLARFPYENRQLSFGSYHTGGVNFVFCDGSVRTLDTSIATDILGRLTTRDDMKFVPDH